MYRQFYSSTFVNNESPLMSNVIVYVSHENRVSHENQVSLEKNILCWQINFAQVSLFMLSYTILRVCFAKNSKNSLLASNIVSCIACWRCLIYHDLSELINYYWYDLVLMTIKKDKLMVFHHVVTLYAISHCPIYEDYEKIMSILWMCKLSDVFVHQYHIAQASDLLNYYPITVKIYQLITIIYTCVAWFVLRIIFIITLFPFQSTKANIMIPIFIAINFYWIIKRIKLAVKIAGTIKCESKYNR